MFKKFLILIIIYLKSFFFSAFNKPLPMFKIPYSLIMSLAILFEYLYRYFGLEPLFTRLEVNFLSITNTYSIERAKHDLGYKPIQNHDLTDVIHYYKRDFNRKNDNKIVISSMLSGKKQYLNVVLLNSINFILFLLIVLFFWIGSVLLL